tara:strand:- start:127 stop:1005 length:879 start_codon:yes stop_codon:yes gene_type:complete
LLSGTIKRAVEVRAARVSRRSGYEFERSGFVAIPPGVDDERTVRALAHTLRSRVQRWHSPGAETRRFMQDENGAGRLGDALGAWRVVEEDAGPYKGRYSQYRMNDYTPTIASYGRATATRLYASIWGVPYKHRAPRGWRYGTDELGIYLVRTRELRERYRYHLTSDDVRGGLASMRGAAIEHAERRRLSDQSNRNRKRMVASERRRIESERRRIESALRGVPIWVGMQDSRAAGNCRAGTVIWAGQNGLDHGRYYPARVIERLQHYHPSVASVIEAARARTLQDLERGFCVV